MWICKPEYVQFLFPGIPVLQSNVDDSMEAVSWWSWIDVLCMIGLWSSVNGLLEFAVKWRVKKKIKNGMELQNIIGYH